MTPEDKARRFNILRNLVKLSGIAIVRETPDVYLFRVDFNDRDRLFDIIKKCGYTEFKKKTIGSGYFIKSPTDMVYVTNLPRQVWTVIITDKKIKE